MSNNGLTFTDSVICYKELIDKEDTARRSWKERYGKQFSTEGMPWRPVEPFERGGASDSKAEVPSGVPVSAIRNPFLYQDTVGNEGFAGGTPLRFGGQWDIVSAKVEQAQDPDKPPRELRKGPHDCYCDIGYNAWSMAGCATQKAQTHHQSINAACHPSLFTACNSLCLACCTFSLFILSVRHAPPILASVELSNESSGRTRQESLRSYGITNPRKRLRRRRSEYRDERVREASASHLNQCMRRLWLVDGSACDGNTNENRLTNR